MTYKEDMREWQRGRRPSMTELSREATPSVPFVASALRANGRRMLRITANSNANQNKAKSHQTNEQTDIFKYYSTKMQEVCISRGHRPVLKTDSQAC